VRDLQVAAECISWGGEKALLFFIITIYRQFGAFGQTQKVAYFGIIALWVE
jgi:hypothetical protein